MSDPNIKTLPPARVRTRQPRGDTSGVVGGPSQSSPSDEPNAEVAEVADQPKAPEAQAAKRDYEIGYGRPPKRHQFKRGQSGNPRGRAKGSRNAATLMADIMAETVTMKVNGKTRKATNLEGMLRRQAQKAITAGDNNSARFILDILDRHEAQRRNAIAAGATAESLAETDQSIIAAFMSRLRESEDEQ